MNPREIEPEGASGAGNMKEPPELVNQGGRTRCRTNQLGLANGPTRARVNAA
jgi:hypothetical protein